MSQAPSMPMYWDAYLADTTHLTTEEHGAYLLLLGAMWRRNGTVPDDDRDNARIIGLTKGKWLKIKQRLSDFLIYENDTISQKKLQKTWKKTQETIEKNRQNGAKGGRPKSKENNDLDKAVGSDSVNPNDNPNVTIPEPEPYIKELSKDSYKVPPKKPKGNASGKHAKRIEAEFGPDWKLPEKYHCYASEQGLQDDGVKSEVQKFFRYWTGPDAKHPAKKDWFRTWQTWIDKSIEWNGNNGDYRNGQSRGSGTPLVDIATELINELGDDVP